MQPVGVKQRHAMSKMPLYPLRFEPIYQYRVWGGRRLADLLTAPLPGDGPIGEAWVVSDRDDYASREHCTSTRRFPALILRKVRSVR